MGERKASSGVGFTLGVEHYTAIVIAGAVLLLLLIGKGITGFSVPLTNVKVSA